MPDDEEKTLLRRGQTLEEWWRENGLDPEEARIKRKATYEKQKKEAEQNWLKQKKD